MSILLCPYLLFILCSEKKFDTICWTPGTTTTTETELEFLTGRDRLVSGRERYGCNQIYLLKLRLLRKYFEILLFGFTKHMYFVKLLPQSVHIKDLRYMKPQIASSCQFNARQVFTIVHFRLSPFVCLHITVFS